MSAQWVRIPANVEIDIGTYGDEVDAEEVAFLLRMGGIDARVASLPACPYCGAALPDVGDWPEQASATGVPSFVCACGALHVDDEDEIIPYPPPAAPSEQEQG